MSHNPINDSERLLPPTVEASSIQLEIDTRLGLPESVQRAANLADTLGYEPEHFNVLTDTIEGRESFFSYHDSLDEDQRRDVTTAALLRMFERQIADGSIQRPNHALSVYEQRDRDLLNDVDRAVDYSSTLTPDQSLEGYAAGNKALLKDLQHGKREGDLRQVAIERGDFYTREGRKDGYSRALKEVEAIPFDWAAPYQPQTPIGKVDSILELVRQHEAERRSAEVQPIIWSEVARDTYSRVTQLGAVLGPKVAEVTLGLSLLAASLGGNTSDAGRQDVLSVDPQIEVIDGVVVANVSQQLESEYPELPSMQSAVDNVLMNHRSLSGFNDGEEEVLAGENLIINDDRLVMAYSLLRSGSTAERDFFGLDTAQIESVATQVDGFDLESYDPNDLEQSAELAVAYLNSELRVFYRVGLERGDYTLEDLTNPIYRADILHDFAKHLHPDATGFAEQFTQTVMNWGTPSNPLLNEGRVQQREVQHVPSRSAESGTNSESLEARISELMPEMQGYVRDIINIANEQGLELIMVPQGGRRTDQEQALLYAQGRTQEQINEAADELISVYGREDLAVMLRATPPQPGDIVTGTTPGQGKHTYGAAVDLAPVVNGSIPWDNAGHPAWQHYGQIAEQVGGENLRWLGPEIGDWPHIELRNFDWEYAIGHPEEYPQPNSRISLSREEFEDKIREIFEANGGSLLPPNEMDTWNQEQWADFERFVEVAEQQQEEQRQQAIEQQRQQELLASQRPDVEQSVIDTAEQIYGDHHEMISQLAEKIDIDEAVLAGILQVESNGGGFNDDGSLKINFEDEYFLHEAGVQLTDLDDAYAVYNQAKAINEEAANRSISMGAPQIMGSHFARLGYSSATEMRQRFIDGGIQEQLRALARFVQTDTGSPSLLEAARNEDWDAFARTYNGSGYAENEYQIKLPNATNAYRWIMLRYQE